MTVRELLDEGNDRLRKVVADNPRFVCEVFLRFILHARRIDLYLEPERELSRPQLDLFRDMVERKLRREPMQHIVAETEWYGLTFKCNRRALVPRPETEVITERAIEKITGSSSAHILDLGSGSGAIAIAIAMEIPSAEVVASDLSADALSLAAENIKLHGLVSRVELREGNLFDTVKDNEKFDLIISNPPYVRSGEYESLMPEVKNFEPREALVAGDDGLAIISELVNNAHRFLAKEGWLVFEFGIDHTNSVVALAKQTGMYTVPEIIVDYNGIDRGAMMQLLR